MSDATTNSSTHTNAAQFLAPRTPQQAGDENTAGMRGIEAGQPGYMYAVYDTRTQFVECAGTHAKCREYMTQQCGGDIHSTYALARGGRWLRMDCLDEPAVCIGERS